MLKAYSAIITTLDILINLCPDEDILDIFMYVKAYSRAHGLFRHILNLI